MFAAAQSKGLLKERAEPNVGTREEYDATFPDSGNTGRKGVR